MNLDVSTIAIVGLSLISATLGWLWRQLWDAVQKLRADLSALETRVGTDYVRYDRLKDAMDPVMDALNEIRTTLRNKVDKQ